MGLKDYFAQNSQVAVAFSGGVDSAYLLYAASRYAKRVYAYYVKSAFQPAFELEDAIKLAETLSVPLRVVSLDLLSEICITANDKNRCYFCKSRILSAILREAKADGFCVVLDGTNADDKADERPGFRALQELKVRSPLRECGLGKDEIRRLSREAGLFTHDKPAYACLATRIAQGELITSEKLEKTEAAEAFLQSLGFRDFRVRMMANAAKLQLKAEQFPFLMQHKEQVVSELKKHYTEVLLDLEERK